MSEGRKDGRRLGSRTRTLLDVGPLAVFLVLYFFGGRVTGVLSGVVGSNLAIAEGQELFVAVAGFMTAFAAAAAYSVCKERRIAPMQLVSFVVVVVLGSLTLFLHDRTFFYMKPTIAYLLFALMLGGGLAWGRNFLKAAFDGALTLPDAAWRKLTGRYTAFFIVLAAINEAAWRWLMRDCDIDAGTRCPGEPTWINLKIFGFTALNILFAAAQAPFIVAHGEHDQGSDR